MGPDRRGFILGSEDAVLYGTRPEDLHVAAIRDLGLPRGYGVVAAPTGAPADDETAVSARPRRPLIGRGFPE